MTAIAVLVKGSGTSSQVACSDLPRETSISELRHAFRGLRSAPLMTAAVVLTMSLGIGATTATFGVVNTVLIKPLPYPESDALVRIVHSIGGVDQPYFSDASIRRTWTTRRRSRPGRVDARRNGNDHRPRRSGGGTHAHGKPRTGDRSVSVQQSAAGFRQPTIRRERQTR
jgi:hypothetical protein